MVTHSYLQMLHLVLSHGNRRRRVQPRHGLGAQRTRLLLLLRRRYHHGWSVVRYLRREEKQLTIIRNRGQKFHIGSQNVQAPFGPVNRHNLVEKANSRLRDLVFCMPMINNYRERIRATQVNITVNLSRLIKTYVCTCLSSSI